MASEFVIASKPSSNKQLMGYYSCPVAQLCQDGMELSLIFKANHSLVHKNTRMFFVFCINRNDR